MDHPVVKRIGAYQLKKHLAASGTVQVYLAQEEGPVRLSGDVILKIVHPVSPEDAAFEEMRRQGPLLCQLSHPAIVRTHRFFEHETALVFVLEYVKGVSLAELPKDPQGSRRLPDAAVFYLASAVLDALAHAHRTSEHARTGTPIVHKAVSPSNVHITREGTVKLGGFGFVEPFGISKEWESPYMAPEQIAGSVPTQKADVYSAALVLWELLTGRPPRPAPESPNAIEAVLRNASAQGPESIASLRPDLPADVLALIEAALTPNPEMRTIKCVDMAQQIRKVAAGGRGREELKALVTAALPAEVTAQLKRAASVARTLPGIPPPATLPNGASQQKPAVPPPPRVARPSPMNVQGPSAVITMPIVDVAGSSDPMPEPAPPTPEPLALHSSTPAVVTTLPPIVESAVSIAAVARGVADRTSIVDQLQKPTRWRRKTLLGIWSGLAVALVATLVATQINRRPAATSSSSVVVSSDSLAPAESAAPQVPQPSEEPTTEGPTSVPSVTRPSRPSRRGSGISPCTRRAQRLRST